MSRDEFGRQLYASVRDGVEYTREEVAEEADDRDPGPDIDDDDIAYTCECEAPERTRYIVTDHEGIEHVCDYCDECADLAAIDWNGETAEIHPLTPRSL